jgi:hypothetical protein
MAKKESPKLENVNVPELFYQHFMKGHVGLPGSALELTHTVVPVKKGRGFTRILPKITQAQYDELYSYGIHARSSMSGADRKTVLRAAICAKAMCERMELAGVTDPKPFVPTRASKKRAADETAPPITSTDDGTAAALTAIAEDATKTEEDTSLNSIVPTEPATLDTVDDLEEVTGEELDNFGKDISYG